MDIMRDLQFWIFLFSLREIILIKTDRYVPCHFKPDIRNYAFLPKSFISIVIVKRQCLSDHYYVFLNFKYTVIWKEMRK